MKAIRLLEDQGSHLYGILTFFPIEHSLGSRTAPTVAMGEALAFIGLAGNIVQFLDAGWQLLSLARKLSRGGIFTENSELELRISVLQASLKTIEEGPECSNDDQLTSLVQGCSKLAEDLMIRLKVLRLNKDKNRLLESATKSFKAMLKKPELEDLESRLIKMRDALCLHLRVLLRYLQAIHRLPLSNIK